MYCVCICKVNDFELSVYQHFVVFDAVILVVMLDSAEWERLREIAVFSVLILLSGTAEQQT